MVNPTGPPHRLPARPSNGNQQKPLAHPTHRTEVYPRSLWLAAIASDTLELSDTGDRLGGETGADPCPVTAAHFTLAGEETPFDGETILRPTNAGHPL